MNGQSGASLYSIPHVIKIVAFDFHVSYAPSNSLVETIRMTYRVNKPIFDNSSNFT
jgi:hypothetical protein